MKKVAALIDLHLDKAFDSICKNEPLLKLWTAGKLGYLFTIIATYPKYIRKQLERLYSSAFVPKGSVLFPLFLYYKSVE